MRKLLLSISIILIHISSIAQDVTIGREVKMLALGDSYTIGQSVSTDGRWPHQFIDELRKQGVSALYPDYIATTGWTTRNLLQGIASSYDSAKRYNLVSILIGVNNQYQGVPIANYEPDLREIIDFALAVVDQDPSRIFFLSIPDYAYTPFGRGNELISQQIDEYNAIKKSVAEEYGIAFIDITPISREGLLNTSLVASDGLHPSEIQYGRWVEAIMPRLRLDLNVFTDDIERLSEDRIRVYPNPAGSTLQIDSSVDIKRISIFNAMGSLVSDQMISSLPGNIDVSSLDSGLYTLWIFHKNDETVSRRKLLVQKD